MLASLLDVPKDKINSAALSIDSPFQMRRRGVELKLNLGVAPPEIDPVLVQNIVKAREWLAMIIAGSTVAEVAEAAGTSKRRIQSVVELALLAPDILAKIAAGEQADALTSDYLVKTSFSAIWAEQQEQFAKW